ncbi:hypothetical protein FOZ62_015624, partial [Perkinsus olseni]
PSRFSTEAGITELNQAIQTLRASAGTSGSSATLSGAASPRPGSARGAHRPAATADTSSVDMLKFWLTTMGDEFTSEEFDTLLRECSIPAGGGGRFQPSLLTDKITDVYNRLYSESPSIATSAVSGESVGPP